MTSAEIVIIITTTASGIVTIVNAISSGWGRKETKDRLTQIHSFTNGTLTDVRNQLHLALDKVSDSNSDLKDVKIQLAIALAKAQELELIIKQRESRVRSTDQKSG